MHAMWATWAETRLSCSATHQLMLCRSAGPGCLRRRMCRKSRTTEVNTSCGRRWRLRERRSRRGQRISAPRRILRRRCARMHWDERLRGRKCRILWTMRSKRSRHCVSWQKSQLTASTIATTTRRSSRHAAAMQTHSGARRTTSTSWPTLPALGKRLRERFLPQECFHVFSCPFGTFFNLWRPFPGARGLIQKTPIVVQQSNSRTAVERRNETSSFVE